MTPTEGPHQRLPLSQEHITSGDPDSGERCPVALALQQGGYHRIKGDQELWVYANTTTLPNGETIFHDPSVIQWIAKFDHNRPVQPGQLVIRHGPDGHELHYQPAGSG